jgi:predicted ATPase/class 3 adenylate cyclase
MRKPPAGTLTFLFTDIEGSTRLWEQNSYAMSEFLARRDAALRRAILAHHGRIFKTAGDSFYAAFARASDALAAALCAQRALVEMGKRGNEETEDHFPISSFPPVPLGVRMVLHTGEVEASGGDYCGTTLCRAARLLAVGHGGQVLLSHATERLVRDGLPEGAGLRDLGTHRLRDLQQPERIYQLLHPDLPADFPPLRSLKAFAHNLPVQPTSFIGRKKEIEEVKRLLGVTRLLTLTGAGGCGKTRLALQAASELLDRYADGVWLVELATVTDPALSWHLVASALGVREELTRPLERTLADFLRSRSALLLLDNCEHMVAACAQLADTLLRASSDLRILATSREALGITGETIWRVPSLTTPISLALPPAAVIPVDTLAQRGPAALPRLGMAEADLAYDVPALMDCEAVRLFVDRAAAARPGFTLTERNAGAVAQICCRLEGIPLAIELAAAQVKSLPLNRIVAHLEEQLHQFRRGGRAFLSRHQTLRAAMDSSYDLLSEKEHALLCRLSAFTGGFTIEAAETICTDFRLNDHSAAIENPKSKIQNTDVLDLLLELVSKSLVIFEEHAEGARYRLLETVRQYGRDRLLESGKADAVRGRHRDYYLRLAEEAEPHLTGPEQAAWLDRLQREHANLRAALEYSVEREVRLRLAGALWRYWMMRGHLTEGRGWLAGAHVRSAVISGAVRAKALNGAGGLALAQGDYAAARALFEESLATWRELNNTRGIAHALYGLGNVACRQGDGAAAGALFEESLRLRCELGDRQGIALALCGLANAARARGDRVAARRFLRESLTIRWSLNDRGGIADCLECFADSAEEEKEAARMYGAAEALRDAIGTTLPPADCVYHDSNFAALRALLGEKAFARAWAEGRAAPLQQVVGQALRSECNNEPLPEPATTAQA